MMSLNDLTLTRAGSVLEQLVTDSTDVSIDASFLGLEGTAHFSGTTAVV